MAVQRQEFYSQGPKSGAVLSIWFPPPARHWSNAPWNLWIWGGLPNDWPNLFITFLIKLPSDNLISGKYCKFWVLTTWCKWFRGWLKFHACGGCVSRVRRREVSKGKEWNQVVTIMSAKGQGDTHGPLVVWQNAWVSWVMVTRQA